MPVSFQEIRGFAGATGVGVLSLLAAFFIASVFADNLPFVIRSLLESPSWSSVAILPFLVAAYVVGLLAIAAVSVTAGFEPPSQVELQPLSAARYLRFEQESEILSGSVFAFCLFATGAFVQIHAWPGWASTLTVTGILCLAVAFGSFRLARVKYRQAMRLINELSPPASSSPPISASETKKEQAHPIQEQ
jgi:hypothetical protein